MIVRTAKPIDVTDSTLATELLLLDRCLASLRESAPARAEGGPEPYATLLARIHSRTARVGIIGLVIWGIYMLITRPWRYS